MKTITFFSEKGGVGKSSFSIMYASWLYHKHGIRVGLADFNDRISGYRRAEIRRRDELRKANPDLPELDQAATWTIVNARPAEIEQYRKNGSQFPKADWFEHEIKEGRLKDFDVVLCDFPGSLTGREFLEICPSGLLNLVVIPTEKDEMTLQSTKKLHTLLNKINQEHCVFINKAQLGLRNLRATYLKLAELLVRSGFPVLPDMISYSERMMAIDKVDNIRSTFSFPDFSLPEYEKITDLGINNLFIDVTRELAKHQDIKGTPGTDLSFIDKLEKTPDSRQMTGSSFPEYEI